MKKLIVPTTFLLGSISSFALADAINNYPGSLCTPYINSQNSTSYYPSIYGSLVNTSDTSVLKVVCPIVLDINETSVISNVTANVVDGHSSKDVKCILRSGSVDKSYLRYGSTRLSSDQSRDVQILSFSNVPLTFSGNEKAIAIMHCELPERDNYYVSYIKSYSADTE
jgi:hypothetical protein